MAYYYSASERAFFSSELMSTDAMPSDKVAVADQTYKQLMADQVAGKLIRTGSGNAPESVDQGLTAATRFGDVSFGKVTGTSLDINGNGDVSGTFQFGGAVTIKGALKAQGGLNVTSITATGTSTLAAVNATNISASGTLKVNGATTLQAVSAKKVTATELDLNGNGDVSGNLVVHGKTTLEALQANGDATIGGLLKVTGTIASQSSAVFGQMVRIRDSRVTRGTTPSTNCFTQVYFGDSTIGADVSGLENINGFLEMGIRSDGRTDLKMVALRNESNSDNSYSASLSVGWYQYGDEWAARATAPTPHENSTGSEIVTVAYGTNHYLKRDGSNRITADGLIWEKATSGGYFTFLRRVNDADASASVGSSQDHFVISGFNQGTIICSGETGGNLENIAKIIAAMDHAESIVLAADRNLEIFTNCGNEADMTATHKHIFKSNGNVQFGGTFVIEDSSLSHHFLMRNSSLIKGTFPETAQYFDIAFVQNAGDATTDRFGAITTRVNPDGSTFTQLVAYKNQAGVNTSAYLGVGFNVDGAPYTTAPPPVTSSDDNSIATTAWVRALFEAGLGSAIPSGVAFPYAGKTVPSGFMACNGGTISRTTYAKLFAAIGTAWGADDGSTTFKLPDWRNRTVMGANTASEVGTYLESGAPNITGYITGGGQSYTTQYGGAFYEYGGSTDTADSGHSTVPVVGFDASRSNPIYGAAEIVQPPAGKALWIIKV